MPLLNREQCGENSKFLRTTTESGEDLNGIRGVDGEPGDQQTDGQKAADAVGPPGEKPT